MRDFLQPFMKPDSYAALRKGYRYPICSLYLDSQDLALYQQTVGGEKDRFKLRVRSYTDDPAQPVYLEVKRKLNNVVHKRRAGMGREAVRTLLDRGRLDLTGLGPQDRRNAEYFYSHVALTEARPLVRVKYMREAYAAHGNEPVRITIDTDLMHAVTLDNNLSHVRGRWTATPLDGVIIEVKFTERFPWWVQDFIQTFGLHQRAVPKYVWSVDHMMMDGRESALAMAGITLPPLRRT
jgi:SPX domain protein involved in polyphosphate accumulation